VAYLIHHLLAFYPSPPKFSKNYLKSVVLSVDLDFFSGISDREFLAYFCSKLAKYGMKLYPDRDQPDLPPLYPFFLIKTEPVGSQ